MGANGVESCMEDLNILSLDLALMVLALYENEELNT